MATEPRRRHHLGNRRAHPAVDVGLVPLLERDRHSSIHAKGAGRYLCPISPNGRAPRSVDDEPEQGFPGLRSGSMRE